MRVLQALSHLDRWDPFLAPHLIRLLAWDGVSEKARDVLIGAGKKVVGQLCDVLLDETQDFTIRRRIPRIIARIGGQRAVYCLETALDDLRFEIRFQCGRSLDYLRQTEPELRFDADRVVEVIEKELSVSKPIWQSRKLMDGRESSDSFSFLDDVLRERTDQSLEHVFSLLAVILPRAPLMTAFRALHSDDRLLHSLALEYLESVIPAKVRGKLIELRDSEHVPMQHRDTQEILSELMKSNQDLLLKLKNPSGDAQPKDGTQSTATES
mgnify:CR=1 FL=1